VTIVLALSFDSGILLCADAPACVPARLPWTSTKIFARSYSAGARGARSIFVISEPNDDTVAALRRAESALDDLPPAEQTIDRMRAVIDAALRTDPLPGAPLLAALYSPIDRQCAAFRSRRTGLEEFVGYDCQGSAAYLAHYLVRDEYRAAQSMDSVDMTTAFSIATQTVQAVRQCPGGCGEATEVIVMYANGRSSNVQRIGPAHFSSFKKAMMSA
jgi:hypothetical protein